MEKRKRLRIWHDSNALNPFEDWDCEPAVMIDYGRNGNFDYSKGEIKSFIDKHLSYGKVMQKKEEFANIVLLEIKYYEDASDDEMYEILIDNIDYSDLRVLEEVLDFLGLPNMLYTSTGYSQSDWAEVLIVLTDEFFERTGADKEHKNEIFDSTRNLFDAWAWGDVFGYTVEEVTETVAITRENFDAGNFTEIYEEYEDWTVVDSCGGFYGRDFETNGMLDYIPEELKEDLLNFDKSLIEYD